MRTFYTDTVLQADGKLVLDHLPFGQGDAVQIFISTREYPAPERPSLGGTVQKYDQPFEPVAQEDWAAMA